MIKKILILLIFALFLPIDITADTVNTVTTNCDNVPLQLATNSSQVVSLIPNSTTMTLLNTSGNFFQVKYNETEGWINRAYTKEGATKTFVQIAAERKKYVRDNRYTYSQSGCKVPTNASINKKVDCSSYVSDVIYWYGVAQEWDAMKKIGRQSSHYFNGIGKKLKRGKTNTFFELVPSTSKALPGDILCYDGHVEIYAGGWSGSKAKVYNCGSTSAIRSSSLITTASRSSSKLTYILRVKSK